MLGMSMIVDKVSVERVKAKLDSLGQKTVVLPGKKETLSEIQERLDREELERAQKVKKRKKVTSEDETEELEKIEMQKRLELARAKQNEEIPVPVAEPDPVDEA